MADSSWHAFVQPSACGRLKKLALKQMNGSQRRGYRGERSGFTKLLDHFRNDFNCAIDIGFSVKSAK